MVDDGFKGAGPAFAIALANGLNDVFTVASGCSWHVSVLPDTGAPAENAQPVWVKLVLGGSLRGGVLLEFQHSAAAIVVANCQQQLDDGSDTEVPGALLELIEAGALRFKDTHTPEYGTFTISGSIQHGVVFDRADVIRILMTNSEDDSVPLLICLDRELADALTAQPKNGEACAARTEATEGRAGKGVVAKANLDLVMDVELDVTLRFGQRQLTLREVLELTSGSVIELDRQVEEPVELLLEGRVIARGEAVVIDGNYGLRIIDVLQSPRRQEPR